jgi:hypothetical protein
MLTDKRACNRLLSIVTMRKLLLSRRHLSLIVLVLLTWRDDSSKGVDALSPNLPWIVHDFHHLIQNAASTISHHPLHISTTTTNLASAAKSSSPLDKNHLQEFVGSIYTKYKHMLDAKPLQTKIITGCTVAFVGDAIAQSREPSDYNLKRAASFVAFDGCWRAVQVITYKPLIETCTGQFSKSLLNQLPLETLSQQAESSHLLGAMEQTLVSQLVLIPRA